MLWCGSSEKERHHYWNMMFRDFAIAFSHEWKLLRCFDSVKTSYRSVKIKRMKDRWKIYRSTFVVVLFASSAVAVVSEQDREKFASDSNERRCVVFSSKRMKSWSKKSGFFWSFDFEASNDNEGEEAWKCWDSTSFEFFLRREICSLWISFFSSSRTKLKSHLIRWQEAHEEQREEQDDFRRSKRMWHERLFESLFQQKCLRSRFRDQMNELMKLERVSQAEHESYFWINHSQSNSLRRTKDVLQKSRLLTKVADAAEVKERSSLMIIYIGSAKSYPYRVH